MAEAMDFKRGDTFTISAVVTTNGVPENLTGWTIKSQLRDGRGALVAELVTAIEDAVNGVYSLTFADTTGWPITELYGDVEYTFGGTILSTETFTVNVVEDITRVEV